VIRPARTIWDTRIQCVCGVIAAREGQETEVFMCANFGQVSLSPPRIIVNPNRIYPIEGMIRRTARFSVSVMAPDQRPAVMRLINLRRREPDKARLAGLGIAVDVSGIPYIADSIQTVFCAVERVLATGDHTVIIGRVLSNLENPARRGETPLLYRDTSGSRSGRGAMRRRMRNLLVASGVPDLIRRLVQRARPPQPADLPLQTYREGGFTEEELTQVLRYDVLDRGRALSAPKPVPRLRRPLGVCVVGTHWGMSQCEAVRAANPKARLFLCGRDAERTARLARRLGAEGHFVGLEAAVRDERVQAVVLALPHHLHREATELVLAAGKDVLVEKPIATTLSDADSMLAAAARTGRILMVAENMHFRTSIRLVAERIAAGDAGEPLHLLVHAGSIRRPENWVADKQKLGGGVFMDIGIHYVRALRILLGEPDAVMAFRPMQLNTRMTGEDGLEAVFSSRVGWQSHFLTSWSAVPGMVPDIILAGELGTFHLWPLAGYYDFYPVAPRPLTRLIGYVRPYSLQNLLMKPVLQRERVTFSGPDDGYAGQMREFLSAVLEGRQPVSPARDGRRDLEIVLRCYEAMESGQRVAIPPIEQPGIRGDQTP